MRKNIFFDEIMRDYERQRCKNKRRLDEYMIDAYKKSPRLKKIDQELAGFNVKISKLVLMDFDEQKINNLRDQNQALIKERKKIFKELELSKKKLDLVNCKLCLDTGYVKNKKCVCFNQKLIKKYYESSNIKIDLKKNYFKEFKLELYSNESSKAHKRSPRTLAQYAYNASVSFIKFFGSKFENLIFYGSTGLGKTFLCNSIARELLIKNHTVLYLMAIDLFNMFEQIRFADRNNSDYNHMLKDMVLECELLIIDDLGSEFDKGTFLSDFFSLLNIRLVNRKPTIINTNLTVENMNEQYTTRVLSRLLGNYKFFEMRGEDIRFIKNNFVSKRCK